MTFTKTWLYRVARYVDKTNLTEFFESAVQQEPPLTKNSSAVSHIYHARKRAYKYLIQAKQAKNNKKFWESLREVSDAFREYQNQAFTVEQLEKEVEKARDKSEKMRFQLQDLISKAAFTYVTLKNPSITSSMILKASQTNDPTVQREASDAYKL